MSNVSRILTLLLLVVSSMGTPHAAEGRLANGVLVIVNNEIITYKDVIQYIAPTLDVLGSRYGDEPAVLQERILEAQREGIEQLVERKLILYEFNQAGFNMPESVIEDRMDEEIKRLGGDRLTLTRTLQAQGRTFESFRKQVSDDFIISNMRQFKLSEQNTAISPYRIEQFYADHLGDYKIGDQYKLRIIMIGAADKPSPELAREIAAEIVAKLNDGAAFETMAGIYSEDAYRAKGGDRGWVELEKEHYHQELESAIQALAPGQHSDVVEAGGAFWVVKLDEVKKDHVKLLSEVRTEIEQTLILEERERKLKRWVERLKKKSFIRYF